MGDTFATTIVLLRLSLFIIKSEAEMWYIRSESRQQHKASLLQKYLTLHQGNYRMGVMKVCEGWVFLFLFIHCRILIVPFKARALNLISTLVADLRKNDAE